MTLTGAHLTLEPLELRHAEGLLAAALEDRREYGWTLVPSDAATARRYIELAIAERERGASIPFATVRRDGKVLGTTRYLNLERWAKAFEPPPPKDAPVDALEIGATWLAASAQRTVANTEAKLLMLGHAFEVMKVKRVTLKTDARNERSRRAIERVGARFDGVLRAWQLGSDGLPRDTAVYSMLPAEWPAAKERLQRAAS